ncbi:MAG: fucose isomerase, partial [Clostridia bacterium]
MSNMPTVKLGIVAVSRDCFPITLSQRRRAEVVRCFQQAGGQIFEAQTIIE